MTNFERKYLNDKYIKFSMQVEKVFNMQTPLSLQHPFSDPFCSLIKKDAVGRKHRKTG